MAERLLNLRDREHLTNQQFAEIAGVSLQAVHKWIKGGDVKQVVLERLAKHFKVKPSWIRYGDVGEFAADANGSDLSPLAVDVARRWMMLSPERQEWFRDLIFTLAFIEKRFPAMRKGRPRGESYDALERAFEHDMRQLKLFK